MIWNERASPRRTRCCIGGAVTSSPSNGLVRNPSDSGAGDLVDQRRLAGAVGADDGVQLAGVERRG